MPSELPVSTCARCGVELPEGTPEGYICAACAELSAEENMATVQGEAVDFTPPAVAAVEQRSEVIGDYEILGKLGQGGMGAVYRARQISLDREVALKILPSQLEEDENYVARFQREAAVAAGLNHPNLVHVYASGVADGVHFIAMELVEGENLRQRLKREPVPMLDALRICLEVARGLQFAWQRAQLIHRDIKPSNIYLAEGGTVKVGDLGLAKSLLSQTSAGLTHTGVAIGTPHYISPEQARGDKTIDLRADIYSLGCTLYELLTGTTPYKATDPLSVMSMHLNSPPPAIMKVLPQCPMPVGRLVNKMLRKGRHERHQTYEELIAAMEQALAQLEQGPASARPSALVSAWKEIGAAEQHGRVMRGAAPAPAPKSPTATALVPVRPAKIGLWLGLVVAVIGMAVGGWWLIRPSAVNNSGGGANAPATPAVAPKPVRTQEGPAPKWLDIMEESGVQSLVGKADRTAQGVVYAPANHWLGPDGHNLQAAALHLRGAVKAPTPLQFTFYFADKRAYRARTREQAGKWTLTHGLPGQEKVLLATDTVPSPEDDGLVHDYLFVRLGGRVSLTVDGTKVLEVPDHETAPGQIGINHPQGELVIEKLEYVVLDGLPEAEALKLAASSASSTSSSATPATATKDAPFTNSLGMKFVPVPITGGPTGGQRVLFSIWETRVQDYEAFVKEAKHPRFKPPFEQSPNHPAVSLNWDDAQAFCVWLNQHERAAGKIGPSELYRLPTDHEWSCAVGLHENPKETPAEKHGKVADSYPWGASWPPSAGAGNFSGEEAGGKEIWNGQQILHGYRDDFPWTAPVGSFPPNALGLYDLAGNAAEWCEDLYEPGGTMRVSRGGSFQHALPVQFLSSSRASYDPHSRTGPIGFRVVLAPADTVAAPAN